MQQILGQVRRCVEDYHMIDAGDEVAVGVSGGKDSLVTLTALARLRAFYPLPFTVRAITLETGTPGMSFDAVAELCRELEVPLHPHPGAGIRHRVRSSGRRRTPAPSAPSCGGAA
ncbi:MAG: hypothetical protein ACLR5H_12490 [Oscillospiraceae bacterium]